MTSNENDQQSLVAVTTVPEVASEAIVVDGAASDSLQVSATQAIADAAEMETELPTALPGELLAARRNELRWTLQEVSQRLKLAPRQITALEANDFASLPGMASVRGFIRSYARLLELDPVPLLEMLSNEPNPAVDPILLRRPPHSFPRRQDSRSSRGASLRATQRPSPWIASAIRSCPVGDGVCGCAGIRYLSPWPTNDKY